MSDLVWLTDSTKNKKKLIQATNLTNSLYLLFSLIILLTVAAIGAEMSHLP